MIITVFCNQYINKDVEKGKEVKMAWLEQCRIETNKQVDHFCKKDGISKRKAIKKISEESGIPESTIDKWVYPRKSYAKNGVTSKTSKRVRRKRRIAAREDFQRLKENISNAIDGLTSWADETIIPETGDERIVAETILNDLPKLVVQMVRLNVDVESILQNISKEVEDEAASGNNG